MSRETLFRINSQEIELDIAANDYAEAMNYNVAELTQQFRHENLSWADAELQGNTVEANRRAIIADHIGNALILSRQVMARQTRRSA